MRLTIEIDTSGAAFNDDPTWSLVNEFQLCSKDVYEILWNHRHDALDWESVLSDSNGNRCGFVRATFDDEKGK